MFGSAPGTAERAAELLIARYPGAHVTGDSGPFIKDVGQLDEGLLASLAAADPDILCVALGNPKQERFIQAYRRASRCTGDDRHRGDSRLHRRWASPGTPVGPARWVWSGWSVPPKNLVGWESDTPTTRLVFFPHLARYLSVIRRYRAHADSLGYDVSGNEVLITVQTGEDGSAAQWAQAVLPPQRRARQ